MGALTALGPLAIDMYLPAFPNIAQGLGASQGEVERTLASYLFGLSLAQLAYGPVSDRFGRKKPLIFGVTLFTLASIGCAFTNDVTHLTLLRIVQAFGGAAGMVIPRAVIRDNLETRDASKALSLLILIMGVTPILGPILGAQVMFIGGWRGIFVIMVVCGALLVYAAARHMRETLPVEKQIPLNIRNIGRNYWALLQHRQFMFYSLAGGFGSAGLFTYIAGSSRVLIDVYGVDPEYFGFLFGLNAASLIAMSQLSARLLNRHSPEKLLKLAQNSIVIVALIGVALTLAGVLNLWLFMVCLMAFMASQGFVLPNSGALALNHQGRRLGSASALMGTIQMLCGTMAGLAISAWHTDTALPMMGLLLISAAFSWLSGRMAFSPPAKTA
ncbi:MAG: Bcr/CflA family drug resistance efflux transporter [Alcaligenaceae bacterium]|nr:Bcr/CflA family drug resistance efflux transporter [Alcaligenaceae bacterium]